MLSKTPHPIKPYSLSMALYRRKPTCLIYRNKQLVGIAMGRTWKSAKDRADQKIRGWEETP